MKTEIIYDGGLAEQRVTYLSNLAKIVIDYSLQMKLKDANMRVEKKEFFRSFVYQHKVKCHVYFDVMVGEFVYDVVVVGDFGVGYMGEGNNPALEVCENVFEIVNLEDLLDQKSPMLFKCGKRYEEGIKKNIREVDIQHVVGNTVRIDQDVFLLSDLWKELSVRRQLLAEEYNTQPYMIYKVGDVVSLLNLLPDKPVMSSPIEPEYQNIIIHAWKCFMRSAS